LTSVGYGDFLAVTLAAWQAVVPSGCLSIATAPGDSLTQRIAADRGVPVLVTDAWSRTDPRCHVGRRPGFNMSLGLDEALGLVPGLRPAPAVGELCGHVNPDCYPLGAWPNEATFAPETVYGFWRYACASPAALTAYLGGDREPDAYPRMKNAKHGPIGYCQIFRWTSGIRFGSYPSAGGFDTDFTRRFAHRAMRDEVFLLHLGGRDRANWAGRTLPRWGAA
jgi:hypothetical protein